MAISEREGLLTNNEENPRAKCHRSFMSFIAVTVGGVIYFVNDAILSNQYSVGCLEGAAAAKSGIPKQISPFDLNQYIQIVTGAGLVLSPYMSATSTWIVSRGYELLNKTKFGLGVLGGMVTTGILFASGYQFQNIIYATGYDAGFTNVTAATLNHICDPARGDQSIPLVDTAFKLTPVITTSLLALSLCKKWRSRGTQNQPEVEARSNSRLEP